MTQPPHDEPTASSPEELRVQVEQTRRQLGETVEALAAKTDVKTRAQEKAAEVKEQAAAKAAQLKDKAAQAAHQAQDKLPDPLKDKAARIAGQTRTAAGQAGRLWQEKAPEPVRQGTALSTRWVRDNRTLLIAGGSAVLLWLACRRKG